MRKDRTIINVITIIFGLIIFVIWHQSFFNKSTPTASFKDVKNYQIYLITTDNQDEFWQYINQGAADMAALTGVKYQWKFPYERNPQKQIEVIREAIDEGADAILVAADDTKKISGVIEDAKAKGIDIIYVDAPANEEAITTLATDNYEAGFAAGQKMISLLEEKEISTGSIGILTYDGKITEMEREEGFADAVTKDAKFKLLPSVNTKGQPLLSQKEAEKLITQKEDLVGIFATNEGISVGLGNANKKVDNKILSIGFDKSTVTTKLLEEGSLNAIIEQNPYTMGYVGMAEAIAALRGKSTGPDFFDTGFTILERNK